MLLRAGLRGTFLLCRPFVKGWVTELSHCETEQKDWAKDAKEQKKLRKKHYSLKDIFC